MQLCMQIIFGNSPPPGRSATHRPVSTHRRPKPRTAFGTPFIEMIDPVLKRPTSALSTTPGYRDERRSGRDLHLWAKVGMYAGQSDSSGPRQVADPSRRAGLSRLASEGRATCGRSEQDPVIILAAALGLQPLFQGFTEAPVVACNRVAVTHGKPVAVLLVLAMICPLGRHSRGASRDLSYPLGGYAARSFARQVPLDLRF